MKFYAHECWLVFGDYILFCKDSGGGEVERAGEDYVKIKTCLHVCLCVKERRKRMSFQINWNTKGSACEHIPTALGHGEKDGANA